MTVPAPSLRALQEAGELAWPVMSMNRQSYLAALHRDGLTFGELCDDAPLDTPVPSCPGWVLADLVYHVTVAHDFWGRMVHEHLTDPSVYERLPRAHDVELLDAYWAAFDRVRTVLEGAPDDQQVWTWTGDQTVGFVVRRLAHETAVHLWDASDALGRRVAVDAELASDGIDEFLTTFQGGAEPGDPSAHVHCTDVAGEWTLRPGDGRYAVTREHAKGDIALRGPASDLLLVLWGRLPAASIDLIGDPDATERFLTHFNRT